MMTKHVGGLPIDEYMAEDGPRTFWITQESDRRWSLWCKIGWANLALLGGDMRPITFEQPEQCVSLFGDHSEFDVAWNDFVARIRGQEPGDAGFLAGDLLKDERGWIGTANSPPISH